MPRYAGGALTLVELIRPEFPKAPVRPKLLELERLLPNELEGDE
jgi:hypothetical protein